MAQLLKRIVGLLLVIFILIQIGVAASLWWWKTHPVQTTMFMRIAYFSNDRQSIKHQWADYKAINPFMAQAVIAAEDNKFLQHNGFDWNSIENALKNNQQEGEVVRGGSTISQQLSKNLFLFNQRSWLRKGEEAVITLMMEQMWTKKRILEVYMNSVEFGKNIYGVEAAAQYYFGRNAMELNREQAAFLAAILPQPVYYQNHRNDAKLRQRQRVILQRMSQIRVPN